MSRRCDPANKVGQIAVVVISDRSRLAVALGGGGTRTSEDKKTKDQTDPANFGHGMSHVLRERPSMDDGKSKEKTKHRERSGKNGNESQLTSQLVEVEHTPMCVYDHAECVDHLFDGTGAMLMGHWRAVSRHWGVPNILKLLEKNARSHKESNLE